MSYDGRYGSGEQLALPGGPVAPPPRTRRWALLAGLFAVVAAMFVLLDHGKKNSAETTGTQQAPSVTVVAPGRQTVDRAIQATGTLAAKREMPVGVAGEGGRVTAVLVER